MSSLEDLRHCVSLDGPQAYKGRYSYILALDVGVKSDATCAVVCHGSDGAVVLDRIMTWRGSRENHVDLAEVERWIVRAWKDYGHPRVRFDPWQAFHLSQRLAAAGVRTEEFTFSSASVGKIALTLYNLIRAHQLALPEDPELIDELSNVRLRESSPGVFRLDHDASRHDDRAVALALAAHAIVEEPPRSKPWVASFGPGGWIDSDNSYERTYFDLGGASIGWVGP